MILAVFMLELRAHYRGFPAEIWGRHSYQMKLPATATARQQAKALPPLSDNKNLYAQQPHHAQGTPTSRRVGSPHVVNTPDDPTVL